MPETRSYPPELVATRRKRMRGADAIATVLVLTGILWSCRVSSEPLAVRFPEGALRAILSLRSRSGELLAAGDLVQTVRNDQVTFRVTYRFRDGSIQEETTVFTQAGRFRLVSSHLSQKGPSFPRVMDLSIDAAAGTVATRYSDEKGPGSLETETMDLPLDLANGMLPIVLKNRPPNGGAFEISMIVATPKPRLVRIVLAKMGNEAISVGGHPHDVGHYQGKVELGGFVGVVAPLVGRQPEDVQLWLLEGEVPVLLRAEAQMYADGPVWRIELAGPDAPSGEAAPATGQR